VTDPSTADDPWLRVQRAEAQLAAALEERNRLWEDAHRARAAERELAHTRRMVEGMQASVSWRVTTPLRSGRVHAAEVRRLTRVLTTKLRERRAAGQG